MKSVAFYTLGCKVNQYETSLMAQQFRENGYDVVDFEKKADIYVINSCAVTNLASRKSRQIASRARKNNKDAIVAMVGCYSEVITSKEKVKKPEFVDVVVGNEKKQDLVDVIKNYDVKDRHNFKIPNIDISTVKKYYQKGRLAQGKHIRESIKIEDGCNNFCTYCVIPYTRGRIRSRDLDDILKEVKNISENGVKEIVLVGIEIASYGKDLEKDISLIDVVEKINEIEKVERIRLGSIEPRFLTEENIVRLSKINKLCNHFHLSVQSLCTPVLKRMNRKYTADFVIERVKLLRKYFMSPGITCDIIVGFINETDEEFDITYNNAEKIGFSDMHVFKFSKREKTAAYDMNTNVTEEKKNERSAKLILLSEKLKSDFESKYIGTKGYVLFDEEKNGKMYGYTSNYIRVRGKGENIRWGEIQEVEFLEVEKGILIGKRVQR